MTTADTNATFCATLVDEWISLGLRAAFVAPGSRSTPVALALADRGEIALEVFHDERSASFAALGHGLATGTPAVLLCTSGTAATHFHGAVAEADASAVPLLVVTADRPPRLWGIGAPQTITQQNLYGSASRAFIEPGVPDADQSEGWRRTADEAWRACLGGPAAPGPVQINLSFEEPLVGQAQTLPPALNTAKNRVDPGVNDRDDGVAAVLSAISGKAGIIITGRGVTEPDDYIALAEHLNWPLVADHRSGCRVPGAVVEHSDALFRIPGFADDIEVALVVGEPLSSKALGIWLGSGVRVVAAMPAGRWIDPQNSAQVVVPEKGLARQLMTAAPGQAGVRQRWMQADATAEAAMRHILAVAGLTEPEVLRAIAVEATAGNAIVVSSSMPARDLEWYAPGRDDVATFANRGANGIDGVTSTAIGVALSGVPTVLAIGDVAFLHDTNALLALRHRQLDLTIVVIDNDGGAIFSFLSQADLLTHERYEQLFGTPHGTDIAALVAAHGIRCVDWAERGEALTSPSGVQVVLAKSDRTANLELHNRLNAAVASKF